MDRSGEILMESPVAIITGAGSGVGRAVATMLAENGHALALAGRTESKLAETASSLATESLCVPADVAKEEDIDALIDRTVERFGRIDVLVNNAGYAPGATIAKTTGRIVRDCLAVNAFGPTYAIARAWPHLAKRGGCIVNISSIATEDPFPVLYAYAAAKASNNVLAKAAAAEGKARGVRAFTVAPGAIETDMLRSLFPESALPKNQTLAPEDVARVVVDCILGRRDADNGTTILLPSP
jgi:meso-butanediol dehydrogenase/(S,S)-butanediol dehydrogenase/diacetyl reductase